MKIQVVSPMWPSPESMHTGVFVRNLSEALVRAGFEVDNRAVIAGKGRGFGGKARVHLGLGRRIVTGAWERADCIYVHAPTWFSPLVELSRWSGGKKLVVHTHGGEVHPHSQVEHATRPIVGWLLRRADLVVAPSRYYAREIVRAFSVPEDRIFISPSGGVNTELFTPRDRRTARRAYSLSESAVVLGFVGRIVDDKGWDVFLQTADRLRKRGRDLHLLVVGDGADAALLDAEATRLGLPCVRPGVLPQADLPLAYAAMDVFLFPTRRGAEALGLVPLEALACGVPVVGSNGYAVPEYVREGENGFLAEERDVEAFARGVERILALAADDLDAMKRAAVETAAAYDTARITAALAERLRALISG